MKLSDFLSEKDWEQYKSDLMCFGTAACQETDKGLKHIPIKELSIEDNTVEFYEPISNFLIARKLKI